jgi:uncharacterized membrane protein YtjA (UPF0391 family)
VFFEDLRALAAVSGTLQTSARFSGREPPKRIVMLGWAVTFLIVALVAAFLGFGGAGIAVEAAKIVFFVAIVLFVISAIVGLVRGRSPTMP